MKKIVMTMMVIGLTAMVAQAAAVHYSFDETAPGTWEVSATVTGADTSGLSAYSVWVYSNPAGVSYVQNTLSSITAGFQPIGFVSVPVQGDVGGNFNAGNFQGFGLASIPGIGMIDPLIVPHPFGGPIVNLGVPALLGTLTTPTGLGVLDLDATSAGALNLANDGFTDVTTTHEVNPIPEPATMILLGAGSLLLIRRKRR